MEVRKTKLECWIKCPRIYELIFLRGIPLTVGIEAKRGRHFHKFAYDFFDRLDVTQLKRLQNTRSVKKFFLTYLSKVPKLVEPLCRNFLLFEANRYVKLTRWYENPLQFFLPLAREFPFKVKGVVPGIVGVGTIDRIDRTSKDTLVLIEYKTSRLLDPLKVKRELGFYAICVEKTFELPISHIACYNPRIPKYFVFPLTKKLKHVVRRRILQFVKAHELGFFPRHESLLCRWCPALNFCLENKEFMKIDG